MFGAGVGFVACFVFLVLAAGFEDYVLYSFRSWITGETDIKKISEHSIDSYVVPGFFAEFMILGGLCGLAHSLRRISLMMADSNSKKNHVKFVACLKFYWKCFLIAFALSFGLPVLPNIVEGKLVVVATIYVYQSVVAENVLGTAFFIQSLFSTFAALVAVVTTGVKFKLRLSGILSLVLLSAILFALAKSNLHFVGGAVSPILVLVWLVWCMK